MDPGRGVRDDMYAPSEARMVSAGTGWRRSLRRPRLCFLYFGPSYPVPHQLDEAPSSDQHRKLYRPQPIHRTPSSFHPPNSAPRKPDPCTTLVSTQHNSIIHKMQCAHAPLKPRLAQFKSGKGETRNEGNFPAAASHLMQAP